MTKNLLLHFVGAIALLICGCQTDPASTSKQPPPSAKDSPPSDRFAGISANDLDSVRLQTKELPSLGISLALPNNWPIAHRIEQEQSIWTAKAPCPNTAKFCANYVLNAAPRQKGIPLKNYGDFIVLSLINKYEKFKLVNRTNDTLNSHPSITMDYIYFEHGLNLGGTTTLYFLDDSIAVINFVALNEPEGEYVSFRGLYTRTLATLKPLKR